MANNKNFFVIIFCIFSGFYGAKVGIFPDSSNASSLLSQQTSHKTGQKKKL
jgi:hypothetical protein